ncbi:MAG: hypothetical protein L3J83_01075 [Proteobacteria bacterium]|nr:hypothetical protein [Pseudomonadota bacterium]
MKIKNKGIIMTNKIIYFILFTFFGSNIGFAKEVKLNWEFEKAVSKDDRYIKRIENSRSYDAKETVSTKVLSAKIVRDKLHFKLLFHNTTESYLCYIINANKESIIMDDEFGDEYKGAELRTKSGQDNKLAPNQRKQVTVVINAPNEDVTLVNTHWGIKHYMLSNNAAACKFKQYNSYNIHKLDWDISTLREE